VTLLELVKAINHHLKSDISPVIREKREGDITHSLANIGKARQLISYIPNVNFAEGIQKTIEYYRFNNGGQD
jgi:nucleoside-diphosphate-sugar epimerase